MLLNIEVTLTGSFLSSKSITLRALVLDDCPLTKISRRLAHRLGLTEFRRVFVNDINSGNIIEEEISVFPISIHCQEALATENAYIQYIAWGGGEILHRTCAVR